MEAVSAEGQFALHVDQESVLYLSTWRSTRPSQGPPTLASLQMCLQRSADAQRDDATVCQASPPRDSIGGVGARDVDSGGYSVGTWLNDHMPAGRYTASYNLAVAGDHPAAGVLVLWFDRLH